MMRYSRRSRAHNITRTIAAFAIVAGGYATVLFASEVAMGLYAPDVVAFENTDSAVVLKPFLRPAGANDVVEHIPIEGSLHIVAVGDIMLDRGVKYIVDKVANGDQSFPFQNIASEIQRADLSFGNLEGPVSDKGANVGSMYSFRMPVGSVDVLARTGFDVLSFANNHVGDWGRDAFGDTLERFRASTIRLTGAGKSLDEAEEVVIKEINGVRVGFVAFSDVGPNWIRATPNSPGLLIASPEDIDRVVGRASEQTDILLVSFHFGDEYQTTSNARQRLLAHAAVDAGADAVIGHHPHVVQEVEEYHGAVIAYSLGNFVFDQRFSEDTSRGMLLELDIQDKRIVSFATKALNFNAYFQPLPTWGISTTTMSNN